MHYITGDPSVPERIRSGKAARAVHLDLGGGGASCFGSGVTISYHELGMKDAFSHVVGLSGGGHNSARFKAGYEQTLIGAKFYYEECLSKKFIDPLRLHRLLNVFYLRSVLAYGSKRFDEPAIRRADGPELWVAATNRALEQVFTRVSQGMQSSVADAVAQGAAIPGAFGLWLRANGFLGMDGSFSNPLPLEKVIAMTDATDVLVVTNRRYEADYDGSLSFQEVAESLLAARNGWRVGALVLSWQRRFYETVRRVHDQLGKIGGARVAILWDQKRDLPSFGGTPEMVKNTIQRGAQSALCAFGEAPRAVKLM